MLGGATRVEPELCLQLPDRPLTVLQELEDPHARGVAEHAEEACFRLVDRPRAVRHQPSLTGNLLSF